MVIAVDFDGTCVTEAFPLVGREIGAAPVLRYLASRGHRIILYTMRSHMMKGAKDPDRGDFSRVDLGRDVLQDAIDWFKDHDIPLFSVNKFPNQEEWTASPKCGCDLFIDDRALGCPMKDVLDGMRINPFVDWIAVTLQLVQRGVIDSKDHYRLLQEITKELNL